MLIKNLDKKQLIVCTIILLAALTRLLPHPPNFTPIIAFAVISAYFFNNRVLAFFILALSLIISDFIIGFYDGFVFNYIILFFLLFTSKILFKNLNFKSVTILSLYGSTNGK